MTTKSSRRNIVRDLSGNRYLLTSRRIVQMDSEDAKEGAPWYALNKDIREVAKTLSEEVSSDYLVVRARASKENPLTIRVLVKMGKTDNTLFYTKLAGSYHLGCGYFDAKTFKRILKNAGVKTIQKAMAASVGA